MRALNPYIQHINPLGETNLFRLAQEILAIHVSQIHLSEINASLTAFKARISNGDFTNAERGIFQAVRSDLREKSTASPMDALFVKTIGYTFYVARAGSSIHSAPADLTSQKGKAFLNWLIKLTTISVSSHENDTLKLMPDFDEKCPNVIRINDTKLYHCSIFDTEAFLTNEQVNILKQISHQNEVYCHADADGFFKSIQNWFI